MISDIFFILRMLALTVIVSLLLQVKLSDKTMEQEFHSWVQNSVFVDQLQVAIDGGVVLAKSGYRQVHSLVNSTFNKMSRHEKRNDKGFGIHLKRYNEDAEEESESTGFRFSPGSRSQAKAQK